MVIVIIKTTKEGETMLSPVTMILRGYSYEEVKCVAEVLLESKVCRNMEITLNSNDPYTIIEKISKEFGNQLNVGAGTVQTFDELKRAINAGAKFVLSPYMMTAEMLKYCHSHNVISVPGSYTPTEIAQSFAWGADIVKVFPANELSLSYAKKICEPMGDLNLMAVGGINASNVKEAFASGYKFIGTAGGLFKKEDIQKLDKQALKKSLIIFEESLN